MRRNLSSKHDEPKSSSTPKSTLLLPSTVLSKSETSSPLIKTFKLLRPPGFEYYAGQAINIFVPTQSEFQSAPATFSLVSSPHPQGDSTLEIAVKSTNYRTIRFLLDEAKEGSQLLIGGNPLGNLHLPLLRAPTAPLVLIGGGIGISPILSIVEQLKSRVHGTIRPENIDIVHQARDTTEFLFWPRLVEFAETTPRVSLSYFSSDVPIPEQSDQIPSSLRRYASVGMLGDSFLATLQLSQAHNFVVCGPKGFVAHTKQLLMTRFGVLERQIFID